MSNLIDESIAEVAENIFKEHKNTGTSVIQLIEDMSQDINLTKDERLNRIEIIVEAME